MNHGRIGIYDNYQNPYPKVSDSYQLNPKLVSCYHLKCQNLIQVAYAHIGKETIYQNHYKIFSWYYQDKKQHKISHLVYISHNGHLLHSTSI